jgi:hypothetical protein
MQAVSAGANGPSSHRKQQEKQKLYGSLKQIFMKSLILSPFADVKIHSTIACHIWELSFCVCCILIFHMY